MNDKRVFLTKHSAAYWRVTLNNPPVNIFGPKTIPQLNEIITAIETDQHVKVVVFDSAVDGFFLTHYDFLAPLEDSTRIPPGPTGLQALPDMLARLSRAPVVSIASIRGRATGVGIAKAMIVFTGTLMLSWATAMAIHRVPAGARLVGASR